MEVWALNELFQSTCAAGCSSADTSTADFDKVLLYMTRPFSTPGCVFLAVQTAAAAESGKGSLSVGPVHLVPEVP